MIIGEDKEARTYLNLSYCSNLEGIEQIIVDTFNYEQVWSNSLNEWQYTQKEPIKLMLVGLDYDLNDEQISLDKLVVFGFRKDKKRKAREEYLWRNNPQFKDIVVQIPEHFHDSARSVFAEAINKLKNRVSTIENNGVKVK